MKKAFATILLLAFVGCADIRIPLAQMGAHLQEVKRDVRTSGSISTEDRLKVNFNLERAVAWNEAAIEHKGMPPQPVVIPETRMDTRRIISEDKLLRQYEAEVEAEKEIRGALTGLWTKLAGGVGGTGLLATILAMMRSMKKKNEALAEYDSAFEEGVPKEKRIKLGKTRPAMSAAHDATG